MPAVERARLGRKFRSASLEVVADMVALLPCRYVGRHGAPVVRCMLDRDVLCTLGRAAPVDPRTCRVAHARRLHPCDRLTGLGGQVDVVIGGRDADGGADVLVMIHGERIRDHPSEAESGREDAGGVDAKVLFDVGQDVIEEGVILLLPRGSIRLWRDEDGGIAGGVGQWLEEVVVLVADSFGGAADPVRGIEQSIWLVHVVVGRNVDDVAPLLAGARDRLLSGGHRGWFAATRTRDRRVLERNGAAGPAGASCAPCSSRAPTSTCRAARTRPAATGPPRFSDNRAPFGPMTWPGFVHRCSGRYTIRDIDEVVRQSLIATPRR